MELHRLQVEPERMDIALRFVSMKDRAGLPRPLRAVAFSTKSQVGVPPAWLFYLNSSHALASREERVADPRLFLCPGNAHRLAAMASSACQGVVSTKNRSSLPAALAAERAAPAWLLCLAWRAEAICIGTVPARFR
jgi:hypothetical protein